MGNFRDLKVWSRSHGLTLEIYKESTTFPKSELFGLTQQIRRAAVSIESNIAEGCGRRTDRELARFCLIANGSANELQCQLLVARDLGYLEKDSHKRLERELAEVASMLSGLVTRLQTNERISKHTD
jgi:four helix bundle protein